MFLASNSFFFVSVGVHVRHDDRDPDPVRVVTVVGTKSVEFCGGTHVKNTADARAFVLLEETAVAKGIRRITGVTTELAEMALERGKFLPTQRKCKR